MKEGGGGKDIRGERKTRGVRRREPSARFCHHHRSIHGVEGETREGARY